MPNYRTPEDELADLYLTNVEYLDNFVTGEMYTWGNNTYGTLGRPNGVSPYSPAAIGIFNDWVDVTSGRATAAGIRADGSLWTWGYGGEGRLGDNTTVSKSSPVQTVAGGTSWKAVTANDSMLALKNDGTLWAWGYGGNGCLGNSSTAHQSSPVQLLVSGAYKKIASGVEHVAAIRDDGSLWLWGQNTSGALGAGDTIHRSFPAQTVAGGTKWQSVSCGWHYSAAIKTNGTLWTWGRNDYGQLGDNTTTHRSSPVQTVAGGSTWKKVVCSYATMYALKSDGTLWSWGHNDYGTVGDSTVVSKSSPVMIGSDYKDIYESFSHNAAAIKNDGSLWVWGAATISTDPTERGVGDGSASHRSSPVQVIQVGTSWKKAVFGGRANAMIVIKD
jgi:alpha-tubulin suppressor-like RCC1 family protein